MSDVRKTRFDLIVPLAFATLAFVPTSSHAAVSVILDCTGGFVASGKHILEEIDYAASTVRERFVNDDGAPDLSKRWERDVTYRARISHFDLLRNCELFTSSKVYQKFSR